MREKNIDLLHVSLPGHDAICAQVEQWERTCKNGKNAAAVTLVAFALSATFSGITEALAASNLVALPPEVPLSSLGQSVVTIMPAVFVLQLTYARTLKSRIDFRVAAEASGLVAVAICLTTAVNYVSRGIPVSSSAIALGLTALGVSSVGLALRNPLRWLGAKVAGPVLNLVGRAKTSALAKKHPEWKGVIDFKFDGSCVGELGTARFVLSPSHRGQPDRECSYAEYLPKRSRGSSLNPFEALHEA